MSKVRGVLIPCGCDTVKCSLSFLAFFFFVVSLNLTPLETSFFFVNLSWLWCLLLVPTHALLRTRETGKRFSGPISIVGTVWNVWHPRGNEWHHWWEVERGIRSMSATDWNAVNPRRTRKKISFGIGPEETVAMGVRINGIAGLMGMRPFGIITFA